MDELDIEKVEARLEPRYYDKVTDTEGMEGLSNQRRILIEALINQRNEMEDSAQTIGAQAAFINFLSDDTKNRYTQQEARDFVNGNKQNDEISETENIHRAINAALAADAEQPSTTARIESPFSKFLGKRH